jgi:hypothetical protein
MDFRELRREYSGKFVAILNDEKVVASADTYTEVFRKVTELGLSERSELSIRFIRPAGGT